MSCIPVFLYSEWPNAFFLYQWVREIVTDFDRNKGLWSFDLNKSYRYNDSNEWQKV